METGTPGAGNAMGRTKKRISPWVWVGCGCGVLLLLGGLAVGGFAYMAVRQMKEAKAISQDPQALAQRIQKIIPYRDLPPGYAPAMVMAIPILTETAIFTRRQPGRGEEPASFRGGDQFIYARSFTPNGGIASEEQRKRFLDQRQGVVPPWLRALPIPMPEVETLRTGSFRVGGHTVYYRAQRTRVKVHGSRQDRFMTVGIVDCVDPLHTHTVMWSSAGGREERPSGETGPDGAARGQPGARAEEGDEAAMADFLGHFQLCFGH